MELFNNENPYYEKWKPGRPSKKALDKRAKYWRWEKYYAGNTKQICNQIPILKTIKQI